MNLKQLNRVLLQLLLLPVLGVSVLSGIFIWQIVNAVHTVNRIERADSGVALATELRSHIIDEVIGLRGYQLTGNPTLLQSYRTAGLPIARELHDLRQHVAGEHGDVALIDRLAAVHTEWLATVNANPTQDASAALTQSMRSKAGTDSMRDLLSQTLASERATRDRTVDHFHHIVRRTVILAVVLALVVGLVIGIFSHARLRAVSSTFTRTMEVMRLRGREVHASEERLRTILKSIGEAVVVCNTQGQIELINAAAQALTGWQETDALRRPIDDVLVLLSNDSGRARLPLPLPHMSSGPSTNAAKIDASLQRRNGETVSVEGVAAPVLSAADAIAGVVIVFRDVTTQRQTQAALLVSEKFAVAGRLAATIAHEIHNPLDAIINLLYLLRQKPSEADREHYIELASGELDRVARISRAMLGMYRESKSAVPVDLAELLRSLLLLMERNLTSAGVRVETELQDDVIVTGFPAELRQVFTNLLTNALDASPKGAVITLHLMRKPGGAIVVVRDQGEGIAAETLKNLFQPFFTTKGDHGTGLGLWVSHGIVEKHGGSLRLETRTVGPERGTDAIVFLPD